MQPYSPSHFTFAGKEKDSETGYYAFGARYYECDLSGIFLSVDPMSDKYPSISPYAYCAWNPVKLVDPDGREINPVYDNYGNYLGNTKEGFTGVPIIVDERRLNQCIEIENDELQNLSAEVVSLYGGYFDDVASQLSNDAQEKIVKHIISQYSDLDLSQNYGFNALDLASKIKYDTDGSKVGNTNFATMRSKSGKSPTVFYFRHSDKSYEFTVENITSSLVYHEWYGHNVMGYGTPDQMKTAHDGGTHYGCYLSVMISPLWGRTTPSYQEFNQTMFNAFFK